MRKLVLAIAAIAVGLAIGEIGARAWLFGLASEEQFARYASLEQRAAKAIDAGESPFKYAPHHYVGYIPTPGYVRGKNPHNELGFRGEAIASPKPDDEFRIVCLGGSTTYTSFVDDHALSYPSLVETELRARGFENVRVINAGAEGYTSYESLITLEFRVLDLDPDMIIVYHAINDVFARIVWPPWAYRGDNSGILHHPDRALRPAPALSRSTLLRILHVRDGGMAPSALANTYVQFAPTGHGWPYVAQSRAGTYPQGIFTTVGADEMLSRNPPVYFERNLANIVAIARRWRIQPVLTTFAYSHEVVDPPLDSPTMAKALEEMNAVTRGLGAELGVPVLDFAAVFPTTPSLHVGAVHVTEEGSRLKAKLFADFLEASELLPERDGLGSTR